MNTIVISSIGICHASGMDICGFSEQLRHQHTEPRAVLKLDDQTIESELLKSKQLEDFRRIDRISKIAMLSSLSCRNQLGLDLAKFINDLGVIMNTTYGAVASSRNFIKSAIENGPKKASPILFPFSVPNAATGVITIELGIRGFNTTISGFNSIGYAFDLLKLNRSEGFFVGGCEEITSEFKFQRLEESNLTKRERILPIAEGSAVMFMTSKQFAIDNNLRMLFQVCGYACICNLDRNDKINNFEVANHETIYEVCSDVLFRSNISIKDFGLIVSLGYSGGNQEEEESIALSKLFGIFLPQIVYPKDRIGESFGASAAFNVIAGYSYLEIMDIKEQYILINNYEIGGNVSSLIIKAI